MLMIIVFNFGKRNSHQSSLKSNIPKSDIRKSLSYFYIRTMYSKTQLVFKYLKYFLAASNGKGHGIHSPFVFDFITKVLNDERDFYCYETIEALRDKLQYDNELVTIEDFGAGSRVEKTKQRSVSTIAKSSLKPKKYSQLLFRMVNYYQPQTILELGTSLGITTAYLASGKTDAQVITMEGASAVVTIARQNFERLNLRNIQLTQGNFDETLAPVISHLSTVNFSFIDGNHRKDPTLNYFHQLLTKTNNDSILIFDDIHWSREMETAWAAIQSHPSVTLTIDLFFIGMVFFRKEQLKKQHFAIRF